MIENGVDLKNRRIYFGGVLSSFDSETSSEFNPMTVEYAIRAIHAMVAESNSKPIEIHMFSYGGDVYSMLRLYDEIQACPCQVKFYGGGAIMSAASCIMAGCDERYLHKNTTVMIHDGSTFFDGSHTDSQINATEDKRVRNLIYDIYAKNSKLSKSFWEDVGQRDVYLTAEEAITLGLADKIIEPKNRGKFRRVRSSVLNSKIESKQLKKLIMNIYKRVNKKSAVNISVNPPEVYPEEDLETLEQVPPEKQAELENKEPSSEEVKS